MERFAAMGKSVSAFVNWEEVFSTNHRGRKEVRYYLKRRDGTSDLAVVGKEKTSGHTKSSSSCRYRYAIRDESLFPSLNLPFELPSKLRSRREVIDWLSGIVTDHSVSAPHQPVNGLSEAGDTLRLDLETFEDAHLNKMSRHTTEFVWVGSAWNCKKKRKHYGAYTRSGVRISVQDFLYVLAEGGRRLVAYLNDLYEDTRGKKMAVVQWFHKVDEVGLDLPHSFNNDKEVFFSLCLQDISIECIDGLATVLSPQHYYRFLKTDVFVHTNLEPFVCRNQIDNDVIKMFDITQVKGYWNQYIHRFMSSVGIRPKKRLRRLADGESNSQNILLAEQFVNEYTIGSEIEVLSQDSGIRGVWFRAVVIKKHKDKLKVRYRDLTDARNESVNLEEWILSSRVAVADALGIRSDGRMTVRPTQSTNKNDCFFEVGCIVDVWLHDGWWEAIVIHKESDDRIHVYFPGEKKRSIFDGKDLRYSQEWLGDEWKQMKHRPDIAVSIYCATETNSQTTKSNDYLSSDLSSENKDFEVADDHHSKEYLLAHLKWSWSTKKRRMGNANNIETAAAVRTRKRDGFLMPVSVKVDHENCKFIRAPFASPLTSLVMSR